MNASVGRRLAATDDFTIFFKEKGIHMLSHRLRRGMLGVVSAYGLSALVAGCAGHTGPTGAPEQVSSVPVVTPQRQTLTRVILQPGYVKAYEQTPIYARIQGYVDAVDVDIGDHVKKGQLLAKLKVPELENDWQAKAARADQAAAQVDQTRAALDAAKANVATVEARVGVALAGISRAEAEYMRWHAEFERAQKMFAGKVYDQQNLDVVQFQLQAADAARVQAKETHLAAKATLHESAAKQMKAVADVTAAQSSLRVAQADRDQAKVWLDYREIKAPFDGLVTLRNVHTGHFIQVSSSGSNNKSAEPLFNVVRIDKMRVNVQVPEYDAALVKEGAAAVVTFQALKGKEIRGCVTRFTWLLDDQARTLRVEIHLPNPDEVLLPGMYVNVAITVEQPNTLTLPADAVFTDGDKNYCFVVDYGKAVKTAVKVGTRNGLVVEVLKKEAKAVDSRQQATWVDFSGSERIVSSNPESLVDGQRVNEAGPK
jgi:HlyD family secretion protein